MIDMSVPLASRNQLANCKNPFQGTTKKVLTVCSAGLLRSPTAAFVLHKEYGFNCRPAGIVHEYALVPVTEALIFWADEIVFMEDGHLQDFRTMFEEKSSFARAKVEAGEFQVLNIPDTYSWMDEELQKLILEIYNPNPEVV